MSVAKNSEAEVVLLQLPFWGIGCPPLANALLKSYLADHGISCKVFDINAHAYAVRGWKFDEHWALKNGYNFCLERETMLAFYRDNRALMLYYINEIRKLRPRIVGCSVQNTSRLLSEIFLEDLRNNIPGINQIMGGPEVAHFMKNTNTLIATNFVDGVCQDEGESALVAYVDAVRNNDGRNVPGMVYKWNGELVNGSPSEYIPKLDVLPVPDFEDFRFKHYHVSSSLPTYSSRGCVNKCNYCSAIGFMTNDRWRFRLRSAEVMFGEIAELVEKYPHVRNFRMCDNISNAKMSTLEKFCDLMISSGLSHKLTWSLENAVIRKEMRAPIYKKLKKAGCTLLGYGMETPSVRLLHDVGKTLATKKDVDLPAILKEGKDAGLIVSVNVMFGLPTETEDDFDFLMRFLKENKDAMNMVNPSLNFCEYYPGSAGHDRPQDYGIDLTHGPLFWRSIDGNSDYLTRMERFEKFCRLAKDFKIENLFNIQELPNKHKLLFEYYFVIEDYDKCIEEFKQIDSQDLTKEISLKYQAVVTNDFSNLGEMEQHDLVLYDFVEDFETFEEVVTKQNLVGVLDDLIDRDVRTSSGTLDPWLQLARTVSHKVMQYDNLDKCVNDILRCIKNVEESRQGSTILQDETVQRQNIFFLNKIAKLAENQSNRYMYRFMNHLFKSSDYFDLIARSARLAIAVLEPEIIDIESTEAVKISRNGAPLSETISLLKEDLYAFGNVDAGRGIFASIFLKGEKFRRIWQRLIGVRLLDNRVIALSTVIDLIAMRCDFWDRDRSEESLIEVDRNQEEFESIGKIAA